MTGGHRPARQSDRWVTPGVVCVAIMTGGVVVLGVAGLVAYLAQRGVDPDPIIRLAAQAAAGVGSLGTLALQLVSRRTVARTERNTGVLANALYDVAEAMPRPRPPAPETVAMRRAAPAPGGE